MNILITGVAGFVGSRLAIAFAEHFEGLNLVGIDNLSRRGSETNLPILKQIGCRWIHGDIRSTDDVRSLPRTDWIIDCAAEPSVLAGIEGGTSQLIGHNLIGTLNLLEKCRQDQSGLVMLSTSRVYSIEALQSLPLKEGPTSYKVWGNATMPNGFSVAGVSENFSTRAPVSLYGATKLASEVMALEYAATFDFPLWINRCGVIAGAGQFGKIDQGIFSFWIYQWLLNRPLSYIGFGGTGKQVRDFFSPQDLARLLVEQITRPDHKAPRIINVGGGRDSAMSLQEISNYCEARFGSHKLASIAETRPFDVPYYVTDSSVAVAAWGWTPQLKAKMILDEIADWAEFNRNLLEAGF